MDNFKAHESDAEITSPFENLDEYYDEEQPDFYEELKDAAFEYLRHNPGSDFGDWSQGLIEQYPTEVVDALGNNPAEVFSDLADLWDSDYYDPATDIEQKFSVWAECFITDASTDLYYHLVDARAETQKAQAKVK